MKKRITSTVILSIIIIICLVAFIALLPVNIQDVLNSANDGSGDASEQVAKGFALAFVAIILVVIILPVYILEILINGICLIFTIKNRKSPIKAVRIINYVLDGLCASMIIGSGIKLLIFFLQNK